MRRSTGPATLQVIIKGVIVFILCHRFHSLYKIGSLTVEDGGKNYVFVFSDLGLSLRHHQEGPGRVPLSTNRIMYVMKKLFTVLLSFVMSLVWFLLRKRLLVPNITLTSLSDQGDIKTGIRDPWGCTRDFYQSLLHAKERGSKYFRGKSQFEFIISSFNFYVFCRQVLNTLIRLRSLVYADEEDRL